MISIVCLFGALFQYWVVKWMLVKHHKKPKQIGDEWDSMARRFLPIALIMAGLSQFFFIYTLSDGKNWTVMIPLVATIVYSLVAPFIMNWKLKFLEVVRLEEDTYDSQNFTCDYKVCNPVQFDEQNSNSKMMIDRLEAYGASDTIQEKTLQIKKAIVTTTLIEGILKNYTKMKSLQVRNDHSEEAKSTKMHSDKKQSKLVKLIVFYSSLILV